MRAEVVLFTILLILAKHSAFQWIIVEDYSPGRDVALSVCVHNGKIYIVGFDEADSIPVMRAEARESSTGALLSVWRGFMGTLYDCYASDDGVYAVGTVNISGRDFGWIIVRFDGDLNVVSMEISNPSDGMDVATSIYLDDVYIYILGAATGSSFNGYRIEKRMAGDLHLRAIHTMEAPLSWMWSYAFPKITSDQNGLLWVLYLYVDSSGIEVPRIEILDKNLNSIKTVDLEVVKGYPYAIVHTQDGHVYIGGSMGIMRIDDRGNILLERKLDGYIVFGLAHIDGNKLLAFSSKIIAPPYITMNSLFVLSENLDIAANVTISTRSPWILWNGRIGIDGNSVYVAASEYRELEPMPKNEMWAVYSVNKAELENIRMYKTHGGVQLIHIPLIIVVLTLVAILVRAIMRRARGSQTYIG